MACRPGHACLPPYSETDDSCEGAVMDEINAIENFRASWPGEGL